MSMVSTVPPPSANFCFPPPAEPGTTSPRRAHRSTPSRAIPAIVVEQTLASPSTASVSVRASSAEPAGRSGRPAHHAHRRSAAVSHDFGTSPVLLTPTMRAASPPSLHPYTFGGSASGSAAVSSSSLTVLAAPTSGPAPQSPTLSPRLTSSPRKPRVSFSTLPPSPGKSLTHKKSFSVGAPVPEKPFADTTSSAGPVAGPSAAAEPVEAPVARAKRPAKTKSKSRHKKVKSWAGNLIRFGSRRESSSSPSPFADDETVPRQLLDEQRSSPFSTPVSMNLSDDEPWGLSPEPTIDLDAALGAFHPSDGVDSEFGSYQFFHRRSESAPEISVGMAFRGLKRKMGPVQEEALDEAEESDSPSSDGAVAASGSSPATSPVLANALPSQPVYRGRTSRSYRFDAAVSPEIPEVREAPTCPFSTAGSMEKVPMLAPSIRIVKDLSDIDNVPLIAAPSVAPGGDLGEPGPELRCSIDSSRQPPALFNVRSLSSPHPSNSSLARGSTHGSVASSRPFVHRVSQDSAANQSMTSQSKKTPASRMWSWLRGKR